MSTPDDWYNDKVRAEAALQRVRELHRSEPVPSLHLRSQFDAWCPTCMTPWPCRTVRALDEQEPADA